MVGEEHEKDIRCNGPCLRSYDRHGSGDRHDASRSGSCELRYRRLLNQAEVAMKVSSPSLHGRVVVKAERFEGNREARQALALSVAGVMTIMLFWNLIMLYLY